MKAQEERLDLPEHRHFPLQALNLSLEEYVLGLHVTSPENKGRRNKPEATVVCGGGLRGDSFSTRIGDAAWGDYYRNLTADDIATAIPVAQVHHFYYQPYSKDLYFYGVKALPQYTA